ncbi:hypothetical protein BDK51DRAFT_34720, partial [Blyttiomyces helicus]
MVVRDAWALFRMAALPYPRSHIVPIPRTFVSKFLSRITSKAEPPPPPTQSPTSGFVHNLRMFLPALAKLLGSSTRRVHLVRFWTHAARGARGFAGTRSGVFTTTGVNHPPRPFVFSATDVRPSVFVSSSVPVPDRTVDDDLRSRLKSRARKRGQLQRRRREGVQFGSGVVQAFRARRGGGLADATRPVPAAIVVRKPETRGFDDEIDQGMVADGAFVRLSIFLYGPPSLELSTLHPTPSTPLTPSKIKPRLLDAEFEKMFISVSKGADEILFEQFIDFMKAQQEDRTSPDQLKVSFQTLAGDK